MPLATTRQFRNAVKIVFGHQVYPCQSYTDKTSRSSADTSSKRHVGIRIRSSRSLTKLDMDNIELILWIQGVTAHTRLGNSSVAMVRGTCIMANPKKSSMKTITY